MGDENITSYHLILTYGTWIDFAWQFSIGFANDWRLLLNVDPKAKARRCLRDHRGLLFVSWLNNRCGNFHVTFLVSLLGVEKMVGESLYMRFPS